MPRTKLTAKAQIYIKIAEGDFAPANLKIGNKLIASFGAEEKAIELRDRIENLKKRL